jgi:aryl-alcohol dehydrogenase-like predicted oxidoreductase
MMNGSILVIGGDRPVYRLGFGAMRLCGPNWCPPDDRAASISTWLLRRSPIMVPIPVTSSATHLQENAEAAQLQLSDEHFTRLNRLARMSRPLPG